MEQYDGTLPSCFSCFTYETECEYNFSNDGRRRPTVAYFDALRSRNEYLEKIFQDLKTGSKADAEEFLRELRNGSESNRLLGQPANSQNQVYSECSQMDGRNINRGGSNQFNGESISNTSILGTGNGLEPLDIGYRKSYPATLTDELSQVMSQLDVDDDGEVCYFGPSSNLNLVSDVPRVAHPPREDDRPGSVSSSLSMPRDILDFDYNSAISPLDPLGTDDGLNTLSYYDYSTTIDASPDATAPGFAQYNSAAQALEDHLLALYWTWQHPFPLLFSKSLFLRDNDMAKTLKYPSNARLKHYSPLLFQAILALAAHLSSRPEVRTDHDDPATAGNHYSRKHVSCSKLNVRVLA